jgi:hypothetical protein
MGRLSVIWFEGLEAQHPRTRIAPEYQEVLEAFIDDLRPETKAELRLVQKITNLDRRLERLAQLVT